MRGFQFFSAFALTASLVLISPNVVRGAFYQNNVRAVRNVGAGADADRHQLRMVTPEDAERAAAFSEYLARAHEEKLKAIKLLEQQKAEEIKALQEEIAALKKASSGSSTLSTAPSAGIVDLHDLSKEDLVAKVHQYQHFMQDYIVKAQEQKFMAVKAAEAETWKKAKARLLQGGIAPATQQAVENGAQVVGSPLYQARNKKLAAAAAAGKSRWGDAEIENVAKLASSSAAVTPSARTVVTASTSSPLYEARNQKLSAAAKVGKSRWGDAEIKKVLERSEESVGYQKITAYAPPVVNGAEQSTTKPLPLPVQSPEVIVADHGLRADGGVDGLTLAERVTWGPTAPANPSANTVPPPPTKIVSSPIVTKSATGSSPVTKATNISPLYQQRVAKVLASAAAGKARWGPEEIEKIKDLAGTTPASSISSVPLPVPSPEVIAADHGLRADGGVGGLTLAERVSWGPTAPANPTSAKTVLPPPTKIHSVPIVTKSATGSSPVTKATNISPLYQQRVAKVLASAAAGKERWGPAEIEKIQGLTATTPSVNIPVPAEVIAADHGLRADGGVGGLTLAERVAFGPTAGAASSVAVSSSASKSSFFASPLYEQRNIKVIKAADAGKSRWGEKEVSRIRNTVVTANWPNSSSGANINVGAALLKGFHP